MPGRDWSWAPQLIFPMTLWQTARDHGYRQRPLPSAVTGSWVWSRCHRACRSPTQSTPVHKLWGRLGGGRLGGCLRASWPPKLNLGQRPRDDPRAQQSRDIIPLTQALTLLTAPLHSGHRMQQYEAAPQPIGVDVFPNSTNNLYHLGTD